MTESLIEVKALTKEFVTKQGGFGWKRNLMKAVDDVSFMIKRGETFGLVGESGCGKSTTGKMLVRLIDPSSGKVFFRGEELTGKNDKEMLPFRRNLQMIFQNPFGSLNPKMTLKQIVEEPLRIHNIDPNRRQDRVLKLLDYVGLSSSFLDRHPAEFSGGQRQRIAIARSLALDPEFIVADEAVSALDVSIQAQILNLLIDLQKECSLTYLFISHDLSVVQYIADRAAVMYLGRIVELADCDAIYDQPLHPYTKMLLACVPVPDPEKPFKFIKKDIAGFQETPPVQGCSFCQRCMERMDICSQKTPLLRELSPGHFAACHLFKP